MEKELIAVKRDHAKLIDAIIAGIPADQAKERMLALDTRRIQLEADLLREPAPSPIRIHPRMAETYRTKIGTLIQQLQAPDGMLEAKETLRGLMSGSCCSPIPTRIGCRFTCRVLWRSCCHWRWGSKRKKC